MGGWHRWRRGEQGTVHVRERGASAETGLNKRCIAGKSGTMWIGGKCNVDESKSMGMRKRIAM